MKLQDAIALTLAVLVAGCGRHDAPATAEAKAESPWKISRNTAGESVITLDPDTQTRLGLKLATVETQQLEPERKAYGRVADPAALAAAVADFETARTAAAASESDLQRMKTLAAQDNASARTLEAAQAAAARDATQAAAARARLLGVWGKAIARLDNLRGLVDALTSGDTALVRLDLPAGDAPGIEPVSARVWGLGGETNAFSAAYLGPVSSVDPQTQSQGFLFRIQSSASRLLPGAAVTGFLRFPGAPVTGRVVPPDAVLRHEGQSWVYIQTGSNEWTRRVISLDRSTPNGWFVPADAGITNAVVVTGAQQLLSEELKGRGGEE